MLFLVKIKNTVYIIISYNVLINDYYAFFTEKWDSKKSITAHKPLLDIQ